MRSFLLGLPTVWATAQLKSRGGGQVWSGRLQDLACRTQWKRGRASGRARKLAIPDLLIPC
ncbi:hypothetical protein MFUM_210040 [Methylacidiphilum fumariolicum SolV]|uniref:Uncharacterized protein n=2 Tax=Candidatus Methylacidiphilum fumarolicum TaxID=591154 RepID=I0JX30_METFB|nr:conserved protein of unknown function [Candidatus Methylacidiphilum fumarolicum]CCG91799.1 hypothetical protein MFUM_210040 [Methylacidiphilum fumariolicum SolV]